MTAISVRNIEKFFKDNHVYISYKHDVIEKFKKVSNGSGIIHNVENVEFVMGDLFNKFCDDFQQDAEHLKIAMDDFAEPKKMNWWF